MEVIMAFCTECGYKLPNGALFCPECGAKLAVAQDCGSVEETENLTQDSGTLNNEAEARKETHELPSGLKNPYYMPEELGYPTSPGMKPKSKGVKVAAIVISAAVILLLIAVVLISQTFQDKNPYVGYWESSAIDNGSGELTNTYLGEKVDGLFGIQINSDGSAFIASAYNTEIENATWVEIEGGIEASDENDVYDLTLMNGRLLLNNEGFYVVFEKSGKDIYHPTVSHGSLSGHDQGSLSEKPDSTLNQNISGSGYIDSDNYYISFVGANDFTDVGGDAAMRVFYEFTNDSSNSVSAGSVLGFTVSQDGDELSETYAFDDSDAYNNQSYRIRPGITIQCCYEFKYDPKGGAVSITAGSWNDKDEEGEVAASYIPGKLPGKPAQHLTKPVSDPKWTESIPNHGTLENCYKVSVQKAENTTDILGNPAVRIYYEYTNGTEYSNSLAETLSVYSYQDGISLETTNVAVFTDTDIGFSKRIAPGETVTASCVFALRNDSSPVEAEIEALSSYDAIGRVFEITK
jgi:hypothetical protein